MYLLAYLSLVAAFLASIFLAALAAVQLLQKDSSLAPPFSGEEDKLPLLPWVERGSLAVAALMTLSSMILVAAFVNNDFSLSYVSRYSDRFLHLFYRITAFWAGQEGSLLFWGWSVAVFGVFFLVSKAYASLGARTRLWFWMFFLAVIAFFLLLLTGWSNPFITLSEVPRDGNGLNPLLQNPGMIFHPPLLFLGYGGFVIPGCLALAQTLSRKRPGREKEGFWSDVCRPFTMTAWILLTAGIVLGAWWAYMELGWGGYWAWDPVENASLIPWLMATAFLHTSVAEARRGMFQRFNILLICLTSISAFVATYIVRSGAIQSLHAYPDGGVGLPLLLFTLAFLFVTLLTILMGEFKSRPMQEPASREGMLLLVAGLFLLLAAVILTATLWPLLSKIWASYSEGLTPDFYNRVCLPLFMLIAALLVYCPWVSWRGSLEGRAGAGGSFFTNNKAALALTLLLALCVPLFWYLMEAPGGLPLGEQLRELTSRPPRHAVAQIAAAAGLSAIVGLALLFILRPNLLRLKATLAAHGVHIGLLLMVIGVSFSGPYQQEGTFVLGIGQSKQIGEYRVKLEDIYKGTGAGYSYYEAELALSRNGKAVGSLAAERRSYFKYPKPFAEAATIFTLGSEPYASLLAVDEDRGLAQIHLTINPLINWLWIGGVLMCLFPLLSLFSQKRNRGGNLPAGRGESWAAERE